MRVRRGRKGWAGWTPVSEDEEKKFKELCLCPDWSRCWALQARLEMCCRGGQDCYVGVQEQELSLWCSMRSENWLGWQLNVVIR